MEFKKGDIYGTHRVISPKGVLPQPADVVDNTMEIYNNEVLIDVHTLNIDSASFTEISNRANGDVEEIKRIILEIVNTTGKHKNPWTGSGGMLISMVCGLLSEVQSMKNVISNIFISTIGVKSTRILTFFCLPFLPSPLPLSVFTSAITLVV